jgi:hypothetical protein
MDASRPSSPVLVCLYEDRPYQIAGLKILLLSLERYCPSWPIHLRFPEIPSAFRIWLQRFPQVRLFDERLPSWGSYDVKPTVLLDGLSTQVDACLWLDTDVLINRELTFMAAIPSDTIVVTQDPWEYQDGSRHRCASWGLSEGRSLPGPINSAVVRVTGQHVDLLEAWRKALLLDAYIAEQAKPVASRNHHLLSDQDALSALLASDQFAALPVLRLSHSVDILQHHGAGAYRLKHRWSNLKKGMPRFVHAMGSMKPWRMPDHPSLIRSLRNYYERTYLELSPYVHYARHYRSQLEEDTRWLDIQTIAGRVGTTVAFNQPQLKGAVQATIHSALSPTRLSPVE